jgi:hypothetical protein
LVLELVSYSQSYAADVEFSRFNGARVFGKIQQIPLEKVIVINAPII